MGSRGMQVATLGLIPREIPRLLHVFYDRKELK